MGRRCIAPNCENTDQKILCHRFPRKRDLTYKWAENLNVSHIKLEWLMDKYTVCCLHFETSDYRHVESNRLNTTACPKLNPLNPKMGIVEIGKTIDSDSIDIGSNDETNEQMVIQNENHTIDEDIQCIYEPPPDFQSSSASLKHDTKIASQDENSEDDLFDGPEDDKTTSEELLADTIELSADIDYVELTEVDMAAAREADEDILSYERLLSKPDLADAETQVDVNELERSDDEDAEFKGISRKELINMIKEQDKLLAEQHTKIESFQKAHLNLLQSIDTFKSLMNV